MKFSAFAGVLLFLCGVVFGQSQERSVPVTALAFSPDGRFLLASGNKEARILSAVDASFQSSLPCDAMRLSSIMFHPGGNFVVLGGGVPGSRGICQVFSWPEKRMLCTLSNREDLITSLSFSPDGRRMAAGCSDSSVELFQFDTTAGTLSSITQLTGHAGPVLAVAFSAGGTNLVTGSADRSIKVWNAETGQLIRSLNHHTAAVYALAFRPGMIDDAESRPQYCASGSEDRSVRVWQPGIGRMVRTIRNHDGPVFAALYNKDGSLLFSGGKEGIIRAIDADSDSILFQWQAHQDWIYSLALSPDGRTLVSGDWSGQIKLWETSAEALRKNGLDERGH